MRKIYGTQLIVTNIMIMRLPQLFNPIQAKNTIVNTKQKQLFMHIKLLHQIDIINTANYQQHSTINACVYPRKHNNPIIITLVFNLPWIHILPSFQSMEVDNRAEQN